MAQLSASPPPSRRFLRLRLGAGGDPRPANRTESSTTHSAESTSDRPQRGAPGTAPFAAQSSAPSTPYLAPSTRPAPALRSAPGDRLDIDLRGVFSIAAVIDATATVRAVGPLASSLWPTTDIDELIGAHAIDSLAAGTRDNFERVLLLAASDGIGRATFDHPSAAGVLEVVAVPVPNTSGSLAPEDALTAIVAFARPPDHIVDHAPLRAILGQVAAALHNSFVSIDIHDRIADANDELCESFTLNTEAHALTGTPVELLYHSLARLTVDPEATVRMLNDAHHALAHPARVDLTLTDGRRFAGVCANAAPAAQGCFWLFRPLWLPPVDAISRETELLRSNERRSALLTTASHEVRGTLHGILGIVEDLRDPAAGRDADDLLDGLTDATSALKELVEQVLDVAQLETGATQLRMSHFDLGGVLRDVRAIVTGLATTHRVVLHVQLEDGFVSWRLGDVVRVKQILTNVVSNAAKSSDGGVVELHVSSPSPGRVRFVVSDRGPGMPPDAVERLTAPRRRPVAYSPNNRGLGLLIVREIVELLDGEITVSVTPGSGTSVTVALPLAEIEPPPTAAAAPTPLDRFSRVLVVDDAPDALQILVRTLQPLAGTIDATEHASEALRFAQQHRYDLVVLDGLMAPHDGAELARAMRALPNGAELAIVIATANVSSVSTSRYLAAGADAVLAKPFSRAELIEIVSRIHQPAG